MGVFPADRLQHLLQLLEPVLPDLPQARRACQAAGAAAWTNFVVQPPSRDSAGRTAQGHRRLATAGAADPPRGQAEARRVRAQASE